MSNDPISLNTSGTNGVNYVGTANTTAPATTPKATPIKDTTSVASQTGTSNTSPTGIDAGVPVLPDPSQMTDAEIFALISSALSTARKQRIVSQSNQEPVYVASYVVTLSPASPGQSSESEDSTSAKTADDKEVKTSDKSAKKSDDSGEGPSQTVISAETQVFTSLASSLSDAINDRLEKKLNKKIPHFTLDAIANFINGLSSSAQQLILLPALGTLGQAGKVFRTDKAAVDTATAVQFGKFTVELVASGQVKSFAEGALKGDTKAAPQLASILESVLVQAAAIQVGNASKLPGLGTQVNIQATVFRQQQEALSTKGSDIVAQVLQNIALPEGTTPSQLTDKVNQAVKDALAEGPFTSRHDLLNALTKQIKQQIPDDETTATALVASLDQESFAAVTAGSLIYLPKFDSSQINKETFSDSIKQAILVAFAKSQEEVNNASKAKARSDEISDAVLAQSYKSESALREAVRAEVKSALADQDITEEQVNQIVAGLNIPADPSDPLYNGNDMAIVPPWLYSSLVQNDYQKTTHIAPSSDLGADYDLVAGISHPDVPVTSSQLLNQAYEAANTETRSYLNLTPQEAQVVAQQELTDPAAVLKNLGDLMNGTIPSDYQQARFV